MDAHNIYSSLVSYGATVRSNYIGMGEFLKRLKENDRWKEAVGDGVETWNQFLKQPEIGLTIAEADKLIKIYELIELHGYDESVIEPIPLSNLKKLVELPEISDDLVAQAASLSDRDFREVIAENNHIEERTYTYTVMRRCKETGNMRKVHAIESDQIKQAFNLNE